MQQPNLPHNEQQRLAALEEYDILDTLPEEDYDYMTRLASEICQTPISLISLIDGHRQWFKSHHGLATSETPKEYALCAHAITTPSEIFIVPDSRKDERFADNPLVTGSPHIIFYTGVPLVNPEGFPLGTLCIIDHTPKELSPNQIESLRALASQVVALLELRKKNSQLSKTQAMLEERNKELEQFAYIVSHDLKAPLTNIVLLTEILQNDYQEKLDAEGAEFLGYLNQSSHKLQKLIDGILAYCKGDSLLAKKHERIDLLEFLHSMTDLLDTQHVGIIHYPAATASLHVNKVVLEQLFINLLGNSIKYNDKQTIVIDIDFSQNDTHYTFSITDNGRGIAKEDQDKIFNLFTNLGQQDRYGKQGTGIGLSTVKKLVERQGGSISVSSELSKGTTFEFTIAR